MTRKENMRYSNSKKVYQYNLRGKLIRVFQALIDVEKSGFSNGNVCLCCLGIRKTHKGFIWSYNLK